MPGRDGRVEPHDGGVEGWTYVNIRRQLIFLERSIDQATQWAVFEPNGPPLWDRVRASIEAILTGLWRKGDLQGAKPAEAFFVRCDRATMTQTDIDDGRLIVEIGFAATRPAEFVVFRIARQVGAPS